MTDPTSSYTHRLNNPLVVVLRVGDLWTRSVSQRDVQQYSNMGHGIHQPSSGWCGGSNSSGSSCAAPILVVNLHPPLVVRCRILVSAPMPLASGYQHGCIFMGKLLHAGARASGSASSRALTSKVFILLFEGKVASLHRAGMKFA